MDVVHGIDRLAASHGRLFLVVGVFDGLHRGHRYLLARLRAAAVARGARPAVITFDAHPDEIVVGAAPPLLCDPDERLARLAAAGVEVTVVQHFDAALRMTEFDGFVAAIQARVRLAGFLMTPDAAFGHDRRGTPASLTELGARWGFEVVVVPPFELDGEPVRSGTVRLDIAAGDLGGARRLLGRPVAVTGEVAPTDGDDGSAIRFPVPVALPPEGAYQATLEPAWGPGGRTGAPRRSVAVVESDGVRLARPVAADGSRVRVAFSARLPQQANPAILRRVTEKTSV
jgi:riboflavin kinase / FMN adenylyltransferase